MPLKNRKSGNCYKFRKAVRHALHALSGLEKKAIVAPPADEEASGGAAATTPSAPKDAPYIHIHNEIRTPERNKSDSAQRRKGCNAFNGFCQCPPHFCQKFEYQPRLRAVPSFIFYPQPFYQQHCRQQEQEQECNCCENNPAGDVPQGQCQCHCECQCCQNPNQQHQNQTEAEVPEKTSETKVPATITAQESQPFDVSTEGYETSYLKDYEKNRQKVVDESIAPGTEEELSTDISAVRTEYTDISALCPRNGNLDSNCNNTEEETIKEVVIVRSAVSGFAESEYGAIDSEDMEWLDKIKETGQTGVLAAEEIERSEKLKRQSIFLNCIRFRTQETLKDVQSVLKMVRETEKRWMDGNDGVDHNGEIVEVGRRIELKKLISAIESYCQDLTSKNHSNGKKAKVGEAQLEAVRELVQNIQTEASGVHKSFQRFTKMVSADTDFLKQLCLGFSFDMCSLEAELKAKDRPIPEYLHWNVKEGDQVSAETESQTTFNFREIFDE
jgi:transcriptional regulator NrdR family protein